MLYELIAVVSLLCGIRAYELALVQFPHCLYCLQVRPGNVAEIKESVLPLCFSSAFSPSTFLYLVIIHHYLCS